MSNSEQRDFLFWELKLDLSVLQLSQYTKGRKEEYELIVPLSGRAGRSQEESQET